MSEDTELTGARGLMKQQLIGADIYDLLHAVLITKPTDFEPYGFRSREGENAWDCSTGCKWFVQLQGKLGLDWGVCSNPLSPRSGLLTFEHQGCPQLEYGEQGVGTVKKEVESLVRST